MQLYSTGACVPPALHPHEGGKGVPEGVAPMRAAMLLLASLAGLSLVRNTSAQEMPPQFPTAAMMRQCPRTSSDVKFMAPNTPANSPCSPLHPDSPYCQPPPCYRGETDAHGTPQGGCHGQDENGQVSKSATTLASCLGTSQAKHVSEWRGGSRMNSATSTLESVKSARPGTAASP